MNQKENEPLVVTIPQELVRDKTLVLMENRTMSENQNTATQTIDSANAANSASSTTNTSHDQQTIQQQNNALFSQNLSQRDQLFTQALTQRDQMFNTTMSKMIDANTTSLMVVMGNITILP